MQLYINNIVTITMKHLQINQFLLLILLMFHYIFLKITIYAVKQIKETKPNRVFGCRMYIHDNEIRQKITHLASFACENFKLFLIYS